MARGIWFVSHFFVRWASQKTYGHAWIARENRTRFSHGRRLFDSCNVQKRATKSDTSCHCLILTGQKLIIVYALHHRAQALDSQICSNADKWLNMYSSSQLYFSRDSYLNYQIFKVPKIKLRTFKSIIIYKVLKKWIRKSLHPWCAWTRLFNAALISHGFVSHTGLISFNFQAIFS